MVLLHPVDPGSLRDSRRLGVSVAGADSNFAIAMTRLGWPAVWLSAVSQDPLGDLVVEMIGGEGVDVSRVRRDPDHPTGVLVKLRKDATKCMRCLRPSAQFWIGASREDGSSSGPLCHFSGRLQ